MIDTEQWWEAFSVSMTKKKNMKYLGNVNEFYLAILLSYK